MSKDGCGDAVEKECLLEGRLSSVERLDRGTGCGDPDFDRGAAFETAVLLLAEEGRVLLVLWRVWNASLTRSRLAC